MSFFGRKKKAEDGDAAAAAPTPASSGYPGAVAQAQQQHHQQGGGGGGSYPGNAGSHYPSYPSAVAGYQPPAFHPAQGPPPPSSSSGGSGYQQAPAQNYAPQQPQYQQQQQPPFAQMSNPHAPSPYYQQNGQQQQQQQQQPYPQQQPQGYPGSSSQSHPQQLPPQPAYHGYSPQAYPPYPQQAQGYPSSSNLHLQQPPQSQPSPHLPHLYHNGYPQQPQAQYGGQYAPAKPPLTGGGGVVGSASSAPTPPPPVSEMKPWENPQQAAARLARAEASEQRAVSAAPPTSSVGGKQKTWSAYQEIEKAEREKQQRIQQRQQRVQQQPQQAGPADFYASPDPSPQQQQPHYQQQAQQQPGVGQYQPQPLQSWPAQPWSEEAAIPDLLTFSPRAADEQRPLEPPTPRAAHPLPNSEEEDAEQQGGEDDRKLVDGYVLRPENEVEEEEEEEEQEEEEEVEVEVEEEEDEEEEDEAAADERKSQQRLEEEHEGVEGQSWQQIGKGKRVVDEFDTDVQGEGQTAEVPVAHLIDYAEKQEGSSGSQLQQPLLASPSSTSGSTEHAQPQLLSPAPVPAVPAFDELQSDNSQALLSGSLAASAMRTAQGSSDTVVLEQPKRMKKKKATQQPAPAPAPSTTAAAGRSLQANFADLSLQALPQQQRSAQAQQKPPAQPPQPSQQPLLQQPQYQQQQPQVMQQAPPTSQAQPSQSMAAAPVAAAVVASPVHPLMSSPYAQRLYAGFAFQLYTDTSSHDLFLFYEPADGPLGTLYWCQPGRREKNAQHSMLLHEITHSVLGKHNFPTSNSRATNAPPLHCFTLYDKVKRLDMCADSGANREEFLAGLEQVIKEGRSSMQPQQQPPTSHQQQPPQPQPVAVSQGPQATVAVRAQPASAAMQPVPAQVLSSQAGQPQQQQPSQPQSQLAPYYGMSPSGHQQQQPAQPQSGTYAAPYPYPQPQPFSIPLQQQQPSAQMAYPAMQAQPFAPSHFAPSAGFVPGMARSAVAQPQYGPGHAAVQQGYPFTQGPVQAMAPPPQLVQENPDLIKPVHAGVGCDSCKTMPIKDVRYKCEHTHTPALPAAAPPVQVTHRCCALRVVCA